MCGIQSNFFWNTKTRRCDKNRYAQFNVFEIKYKPYKNEFWNEKEAKKIFQIFPFYNVLIEEPKVKHLSNIELLHELPFYDELSVVEISKEFKDTQGVIKLK